MVNVILPGLPEAIPEVAGSAPQTGAETGDAAFAEALIAALEPSGGQEQQATPLPVDDQLLAESEDGEAEPRADAQVQVAFVPAVSAQVQRVMPDPVLEQSMVEAVSAVEVGAEISPVSDIAESTVQNVPPTGENVEAATAALLSQLEAVEPEVVAVRNAPVQSQGTEDASAEQAAMPVVGEEAVASEVEAASEAQPSTVAAGMGESTRTERSARVRPDREATRMLAREVRHWSDSSFGELRKASTPEPSQSLNPEPAGPVESIAQSLRRPTHVAGEPAPPPEATDRTRPQDAPRAQTEQAPVVQPFTEVRADVEADVNGRDSEVPVQPIAAADQPVRSEATRTEFGVVKQTEQAPRTEQHTRVIEQIVRDVQLSQSNGRKDIVVRLDPPELGTLRLQITQDMAGMTSHIQASTDQVKGLLQAHVPALIDALSNAGIRVDAVSVSSGPMFGAFAQDAGNAYGRQDQSKRGAAGRQAMGGLDAPSIFAAQQAQTAYQAGYSWLA